VLFGVLMLTAAVNSQWTQKSVFQFTEETKTNKEEDSSKSSHLRRQAEQNNEKTSGAASRYESKLKDADLSLSLKQQQRFHKKKDELEDHFPIEKRYRAYSDQWAATPLNDEFAYVHIYKNGGTTVVKQTGNHQTEIVDPKISNLNWMTFVRDPIDHFLSGWAECGERSRETSDLSYDMRIRNWLDDTKAAIQTRHGCAIHSFPQGTFLLNREGHVYPQMALIGDLREMVEVLGIAGFEYDENRGEGRIASANLFKQEHYPSRKDLISDETMRYICAFVAIDYFLFDFEPPQACQATSS